MKKIYLLLLSFSLCFCACQGTKQLSKSPERMMKILQGHWRMIDMSDFEKTIVGNIEDLPPFGRYQLLLRGDTLFYSSLDHPEVAPSFQQRILKLSRRRLWLLGDGIVEKWRRVKK